MIGAVERVFEHALISHNFTAYELLHTSLLRTPDQVVLLRQC